MREGDNERHIERGREKEIESVCERDSSAETHHTPAHSRPSISGSGKRKDASFPSFETA